MEGKADYLICCQVTMKFPPITIISLYSGMFVTVLKYFSRH